MHTSIKMHSSIIMHALINMHQSINPANDSFITIIAISGVIVVKCSCSYNTAAYVRHFYEAHYISSVQVAMVILRAPVTLSRRG